MRISWAVLGLLVSAVVSAPALAKGDAVAGAKVWKRCVACHALDPKKRLTGPHLSGLIGRKVGSVPGFKYSADYAASKQVWDAKFLDTYLANPKAVFKSSRMVFRVTNPKDRADVIAYLATNPK